MEPTYNPPAVPEPTPDQPAVPEPTPDQPAVPEQIQHHNVLLDRVKLPGETFKLPSGGIFYDHGELSSEVVDGEVHVYPMTAIDEIMIKTPDLLFSGKSIVEIFSRCIPQVLKANELFAKDVDFLLICLRKVTFGDEIELEFTHDCDHAKTHKYKVFMSTFLNRTKYIDPSKIATYSATLDNGQVVTLNPIRFGNFVKIMQNTSTIDKTRADDTDYIINQAHIIMIDSLLSAISSVDATTDKADIREWLDTISSGWIRVIAKVIETTTEWGPEFTSTETCIDCKKKFELLAPLNPIAFFT